MVAMEWKENGEKIPCDDLLIWLVSRCFLKKLSLDYLLVVVEAYGLGLGVGAFLYRNWYDFPFDHC